MRRPQHRVEGTPPAGRVRIAALVGFALIVAVSGACAGPDVTLTPEVPALHPQVDAWPASVVTITPEPDRDGAAPEGADGTVRVDVRVADTEERRARGLMQIAEVPEGSGMLFVFPSDHHGAFWMRDTLVPLDIAFARADGTIAAVLTMPVCEEDPCPLHHPGATYRVALEVPAGWFAAVGVEVGDRLHWTDPQPAGTAS